MARRPSNLARGGNSQLGGLDKGSRSEIRGLKELEGKLRDLLPSNPEISNGVGSVVAEAAEHTAGLMRSSARAAGWPDSVIRTIFSYGRGMADRKRLTALAGVNKQRSMVVWRAGRNPKSPNAKVSPGGKVAMSRAAMLEFGTSREPARPAIRSAVSQARAAVVSIMSGGLQKLLAKVSK